tara:strand:- start:125 stop:361 length:237 start_codon:yes stop_codon:yes gene_type:complete
MTQVEKNVIFYNYVEVNFPRYTIVEDFSGFCFLKPIIEDSEDEILYNTNNSTLEGMEWASADTLNDINLMEIFISSLT